MSTKTPQQILDELAGMPRAPARAPEAVPSPDLETATPSPVSQLQAVAGPNNKRLALVIGVVVGAMLGVMGVEWLLGLPGWIKVAALLPLVAALWWRGQAVRAWVAKRPPSSGTCPGGSSPVPQNRSCTP